MRNYELRLDIIEDEKVLSSIKINRENLVELLTTFQIQLVIELEKLGEKEKVIDYDIPF